MHGFAGAFEDAHPPQNFGNLLVLVFDDCQHEISVSSGHLSRHALDAPEIVDNNLAVFAEGKVGEVGVGVQEPVFKEAAKEELEQHPGATIPELLRVGFGAEF